MISPSNDSFTPQGENATFTCTEIVPLFSSFIVTGDREHLDTTDQDEKMALENKDIFVNEIDDTIVLTVLATLQNNGTLIKCRETNPQSGQSAVFTDEPTLIVIGTHKDSVSMHAILLLCL